MNQLFISVTVLWMIACIVMPYTITIYLKSDNDIYMKFGAEFSKFISETDLNHWEETAINALISMSGGTKAMIISKSEYEENIDETEA